MAAKCFAPVMGKRIRVMTLDQCGNPVTGGSCAEVVTDGFVTVTLQSQIENGNEILQKKANGQLCVNFKAPDIFKRFNVEVEFCGVDPDLLALLTNAQAYVDYNGASAGVAVYSGAITDKFSLEVWTGLSGQACPTGVQEASGYMLLPFINGGTLSDIVVDGQNAVSFKMTGGYTLDGNAWGKGLHKVVQDASGVAAVLPSNLDPLEHLLVTQTGIAPPPSACGCAAFNPAV